MTTVIAQHWREKNSRKKERALDGRYLKIGTGNRGVCSVSIYRVIGYTNSQAIIRKAARFVISESPDYIRYIPIMNYKVSHTNDRSR